MHGGRPRMMIYTHCLQGGRGGRHSERDAAKAAAGRVRDVPQPAESPSGQGMPAQGSRRRGRGAHRRTWFTIPKPLAAGAQSRYEGSGRRSGTRGGHLRCSPCGRRNDSFPPAAGAHARRRRCSEGALANGWCHASLTAPAWVVGGWAHASVLSTFQWCIWVLLRLPDGRRTRASLCQWLQAFARQRALLLPAQGTC